MHITVQTLFQVYKAYFFFVTCKNVHCSNVFYSSANESDVDNACSIHRNNGHFNTLKQYLMAYDVNDIFFLALEKSNKDFWNIKVKYKQSTQISLKDIL